MTLLRTSIPPLACFAVDFFQYIGARQARDGNEPDLLLDDITAGLQEGLELRDAFVEALALPLDLCRVASRRVDGVPCVCVCVYIPSTATPSSRRDHGETIASKALP